MVIDVEFKPVSLLIRIKNATTDDELLALYTEGLDYKYAADKTRRRWNEAIDAGRKRIHQEAKAETEKKHKPKPKPRSVSKRRQG